MPDETGLLSGVLLPLGGTCMGVPTEEDLGRWGWKPHVSSR